MAITENASSASCSIPKAHVPTSAIMKPIGDSCNLRCDYCYYRDSHRGEPRPELNRMRLQIADQAMRQLMDAAGSPVQFIWHGGEPLLAGKEFYREIIKVQTHYPKRRFRNLMQTNATLVDSEWADFLAENQFGVGVSLDGPPEVHNAHRRDGRRIGSFDRTVAGVQKLRAAGNKVSAIAVITKTSLPHADAILKFFLDMDIPCFSLNPLFEADLEYSVTPDEYAGFLCEVFDRYAIFEDPEIKIEPLESIIKPFIGERVTRCSHSGLCARHVVIKNDGGIHPCDRFDSKTYEFGNVMNGGIAAALAGEVRRNFVRAIKNRVESCAGCKWFKSCHGSCTIGYIENPGSDGPYCAANRKMLQYISDNFDFETVKPGPGRRELEPVFF